MIAALRTTWALFFGIALIMLGHGLQGTLLGLRAALEAFPPVVTGMMMSGYYLGFLAGSIVTPRFIQKVGHVRVFAALASIASASVLCHAVIIDPWAWTAIRILTGFGYAGLYVVAESWLNDGATNKTRGGILSIYMIVTLVGMSCGQLLLGTGDPKSFHLFVLVSILVSFALVPILLSVSRAPAFEAPEKVSIVYLYRKSPLGTVGCFFVGFGTGAFLGMGAVYANAIGLDTQNVALFMFAGVAGGILLQWPIGRLSDLFDRRTVMIIVALAAALTTFTVAFFGSGLELILFVMVGLLGGLTFPLYSLCIAHCNDRLAASEIVSASATLVLVNGLGAIFGPLVCGWVLNQYGPNGIFYVITAAYSVIVIFGVYRMTQRQAVPGEKQRRFRSSPARASSMVAGLHKINIREEQDRDIARMSRMRR